VYIAWVTTTRHTYRGNNMGPPIEEQPGRAWRSTIAGKEVRPPGGRHSMISPAIATSLPAPPAAAPAPGETPSRTAASPTPSRTVASPTPSRRTARPTPSRAGPTQTRVAKAVDRATSDPYPSSPVHGPPAAPAAANDSSLLDEVDGGEAELSRRCDRYGSRPIGSCAKRNRSRKSCGRECSLNHC
jgi:hypothetical protein